MICSGQIGSDHFWRHVAYGCLLTETRMSPRDGHSEVRRRLARLFDYVEDSQLNGEEPLPRGEESDEGTLSVAPSPQPLPSRETSEEF